MFAPLVLTFLFLAIFFQNLLALFAAAFFLFGGSLNLLYFYFQVRYLIIDANIKQEQFHLRYLDGNKPKELDVPLSEVSSELKERMVRGVSFFYLQIYHHHHFILKQYNSDIWPYNRLKELHDQLPTPKWHRPLP